MFIQRVKRASLAEFCGGLTPPSPHTPQRARSDQDVLASLCAAPGLFLQAETCIRKSCPGLPQNLRLELYCTLPLLPLTLVPSLLCSFSNSTFCSILGIVRLGAGLVTITDGYREPLSNLELVEPVWQGAQPALSIPQQRHGHGSPSSRDPETEPRHTQIYLGITKDVIEEKRGRKKIKEKRVMCLQDMGTWFSFHWGWLHNTQNSRNIQQNRQLQKLCSCSQRRDTGQLHLCWIWHKWCQCEQAG